MTAIKNVLDTVYTDVVYTAFMSTAERRVAAGRKLVIFELDRRLYRHLRRIALYRGETMAQVLRKSVLDYIRRYGVMGEK